MIFDQSDLNALAPPDHLRHLPTEDVARVVAIVISNIPHMPTTLGAELQAFAETRTISVARTLANALRHYHGQPGLAGEVEDLLNEVAP
jgi:hypothetical protein